MFKHLEAMICAEDGGITYETRDVEIPFSLPDGYEVESVQIEHRPEPETIFHVIGPDGSSTALGQAEVEAMAEGRMLFPMPASYRKLRDVVSGAGVSSYPWAINRLGQGESGVEGKSDEYFEQWIAAEDEYQYVAYIKPRWESLEQARVTNHARNSKIKERYSWKVDYALAHGLTPPEPSNEDEWKQYQFSMNRDGKAIPDKVRNIWEQ